MTDLMSAAIRTLRLAFLLLLALPVAGAAQAERLVADPAEVVLELGSSAQVSIRFEAAGGVLQMGVPVRVVGPRGALEWDDGTVTGLSVGEHELVATLSEGLDGEPLILRIPVRVHWPAISQLRISQRDERLRGYAGTRLLLDAVAEHADGSARPDPEIVWRSSDPSIAEVDRFGQLHAIRAGSAEVTATVEGVTGRWTIDVAPFPEGDFNPTTEAPETEVRTGDVVHIDTGHPTDDLAVEWGVERVDGDFSEAGSSAGAQVVEGRFVADHPGLYRVHMAAGDQRASVALEVVPRDVVEELEVVGHGLEDWYRTTDLWVYEGVDGRDYAVTGSKVSGGFAFFYDVTDPASIVKYDSIQVDARTVNDVKVSPDGRYAVLSREGASNRQNGVIVVDLADPRNPVVASEFGDGITGGVHNVFLTNEHLFALSDGDRYVIIDMADIHAPEYVSEYDHPDSRIHDVWVHDGIAYSSEWGTGVVVVDVGNGRWGGTIEEPRLVTTFALPTGATHAAFPYWSESAQKMYLFVGDEIMSRRGLAWSGYPRSMGSYSQRYDPETGLNGIPLTTTGYIQVVDFTDPENPAMVARYEVPEFGTHNFWIEDDRLYQAYYEGGVRVVDVSGELMGNLYEQGREIAVFKSAHPEGYTPNATMVWGAQPHKGHVFFSDTNSGLWSIRLIPRTRPIS